MKTKHIMALAASALALAGCQKDNPDMECIGGNMVVRFAPSVTGIYDAFTRGTLINDPGSGTGEVKPLETFSGVTGFMVSAWDDSSTPARIIPETGSEYCEVTYSSEDSEWKCADDYLWKKGETKTFYAYANLPSSYATAASALDSNVPVQTLDITSLPAASASQEDILLGYYTNGTTAKTDGMVPIRFYHPMTAVIFKKGTFKSTDATITGISIEGVYTGGTATMSAATVATADKVAWTGCTGSQTVALSSTTVDGDGFIGDAFVLIPQTFPATSTARIKVILSDGNELYYPLAGTSWKAGWTNTYTISFTGIRQFAISIESYNDGTL